jgi:hypothetical protein
VRERMTARLIMRSAIDMQVENAVEKFFSRYDNTLDLLREFLVSRRNRQEFVLLSCARLDSLANLAFAEGNQKSRFSRFLARYSGLGEQTFAISVPDLNYYFQHYFWISAANVPEPGRMRLFRERDREFAQFIFDSGIPVTEAHVRKLLAGVMSTLKEKYRTSPSQSPRKKTCGAPREVVEAIRESVRGAGGHHQPDVSPIKSLVGAYAVGTLLHRRYRSGAIHEWGVKLDDENFFNATSVYWNEAPVHSHRFLKIQFPAILLLSLLRRSIETYKRELLETKKLPFGVWVGSGLGEDLLDRRSIFPDTPAKLGVR